MDQDKTIGEIARSVDRIELQVQHLGAQMQLAIAPITAHAVLIENQQKAIDRVEVHLESTDTRVHTIQLRATFISGAVSSAAWILNYILGRH